ncbi:MAG: hypothetical protein KAQ83_01720 [Nanoarchaeota archaeon]|nr:hypothetical protein [Nanoarchaeota archaeon]
MIDEISDKVQDCYLSITFKDGTTEEDIAELTKFMNLYYTARFNKNLNKDNRRDCVKYNEPSNSIGLMSLDNEKGENLYEATKIGKLSRLYNMISKGLARLRSEEINPLNINYTMINKGVARVITEILPELKPEEFELIARIDLKEAHWEYEGKTKQN